MQRRKINTRCIVHAESLSPAIMGLCELATQSALKNHSESINKSSFAVSVIELLAQTHFFNKYKNSFKSNQITSRHCRN
jgi:hypothetical protein